jgi:drug/metabolite transporter (DMT)-like permease
MRPAHLVALLGMNLLWAGSYAVFKALSARLTHGEIVTWRFTLAAVVVAALWRRLPGRAPYGWDLVRCAGMGVLVFVVGARLQVLGVHLGRAGDSAIVVALEPLVTALGAAWFLREHVPVYRWIGFGVGMGGVVVLNGGWRLGLDGGAFVANLVFMASFVCESAYSVLGKPVLSRASPIKVVGVSLFIGAAINLVLDGPGAFARAPSLTLVDWGGLVFLFLICTLVGYTLWFVVIRDSDVSLAALTILVQPAFGVLAAWLFLSEPLHWGQVWGSLVILGGVGLGFYRRADRRAQRGRVDRSCSQATSGLPGEAAMSGILPALTRGGTVRSSTQRRSSACPSAKDNPPARL